MIIGHGDIASVLVDRPDRLFFASGVSNSRETRESQYRREKKLLLKQDKTLHLVYFSSLCVFYSNNRYARHKKEMENLVKKHFPHYTILRLGNITWGVNPHTLINFFKKQVQEKRPLQIRRVHRYLIANRYELLHWINLIPDWNCEMNITGIKMLVKDIVNKYVLRKRLSK